MIQDLEIELTDWFLEEGWDVYNNPEPQYFSNVDYTLTASIDTLIVNSTFSSRELESTPHIIPIGNYEIKVLSKSFNHQQQYISMIVREK